MAKTISKESRLLQKENNQIAKELGYPRGIKQFVEENSDVPIQKKISLSLTFEEGRKALSCFEAFSEMMISQEDKILFSNLAKKLEVKI